MSAVRVCMRVNNRFTHDARVKREADALAAAGYDVTVVADLRDGLPAEERVGDITVKRVGKTSRIPYWSLIAPLKAERADIYHAHDIDSLLPCLAAARLAGRRPDGRRARVVYDSHELWSGHAADKVHAKRQRLVRQEGRMLHRADALITASPAYTDEIVTRYGYTGPAVTLLNVPRTFTDEELAPHWAKRDAETVVRVSAVSVFQHGRGAMVLIEALEFLPEEFVVDLVGPIPQPDYEAMMRSAAQPFGERVRFVGPVPATEVVPTLAEAHISAVLIEPLSKSYELTGPNKLFDSMMAGTPAVASDMRVIGEVTRAEKTGVVCDVSDARDVARAILEAAERQRELRANARAAATRYNWEVEQGKLLGLYEKLR